ncbi:MAG TPA: RidA family protein [Thermoanaerobaculia bacterium]|nr:RidA family protein [Thermoanaerobaculia bacterium]
MIALTPINPESLGAPHGYSNGVLVPAGARLLFVAGQVAWNADQEIESDDFCVQFDTALANVLTVVRAAGGSAESIARLTCYVTSREAYLADLATLGKVYRQHMGRHFPAMALVEVRALVDPRAQVEIEATAALA